MSEALPPGARHAPATARNRDPILEVLRRALPAAGWVLEIASGTGEHALCFSAALPHLTWQPSDPDPQARASIEAWRTARGGPTLLPPLALDVTQAPWPLPPGLGAPAAMVCINMVHISPWAATEALFEGARRLLSPGAPLLLYGPYTIDGAHTAPSNAAFDQSLRARDPRWGVRDVEAIRALGARTGLELIETVALPANNLILRLQRR